MALSPSAPESITFGRFRVLPARRELLANDQPIKLGGRAFDVLMALIETPGAVVAKGDLLARAWPRRVVEENNLQTQILALRQAFGSDRYLIRTVAGRGYQFTGDVDVISPDPAAPDAAHAAADTVSPRTNLPQSVSELIGRDADLAEVSALLTACRLITLTGAGGIGKTRLALAAARRLLPRFPDGVWLAEFSPLTDGDLVPATVAAAVGLELGGGELSVQRLTQGLASRRLLLVFDTCEHVIDAAAALAEAVQRAGSAARIIATSREPLRADGEQRYPVSPLAVPGEEAQNLMDHGAVQLFVARAQAAGSDMVPDRSQATTIAAICRSLDGIPLAIEMAAARLAALGAEELARHLNGRLLLLTGGRRTALPRHQTLRATLDWSHELLTEPEQILLRRLAVFTSGFSLEAAGAVAASAEITSLDVIECISSLVAKSLVVADVGHSIPRYRLLDTTRAYALEKLAESGEREPFGCRHAEYYRDLFEQAEADLAMRPTTVWLGAFGPQIDNLRAALVWAFSPGGDVAIGLALTAAATPLWMLLSLFEECRDRVERALTAHDVNAEGSARYAMKLYAALGASVISGAKTTLMTLEGAWSATLELAERLDDVEYQLRALWGLWVMNWAIGRHRIALALAQKFWALPVNRSDLNDQLVGDRLIGVSEHFLGNLTRARHHLEHMLANYVPPIHQSELIRFQIDQRVVASAFLGRILWLQGYPDQALHAAAQSVDDARQAGHVMSLSYVLAHGAYPVALWAGDLALADCYARMLNELSIRHSLARWRSFGDAHQGILAIRRGEVETGLQLLQAGLGKSGDVNAAFRLFLFLAEMAHALACEGQIEEGLATIEGAIARAGANEERWSIAELLRVKGELLLLQGRANAIAAAEFQFRRALNWARQQGTLSWELRAATSLARLLCDQGQADQGMALLRQVYDRFTEGFETADLTKAKARFADPRAHPG